MGQDQVSGGNYKIIKWKFLKIESEIAVKSDKQY